MWGRDAGDSGQHEAARAEARSYAIRVASFFAALFLVYGVHLPYFPVWLDSRGLGTTEIAIVTAAPFFLRLAVTPALCVLADRLGNHRQMALAMSWVALIAVLALSKAYGFPALLALSLAFMLATSTIMPLTETVAVRGVRSRGLDYGRMRLWGSLTFILASALGGALLDRAGASIIVWLIAAGALATVAAAHLLPRPQRPTMPRPAGSLEPQPRRALQLIRSPLFLTFLIAVGAVQGAHATFYTFGVLHWQEQGITAAWTGALWAIAIAAEILLFACSGPVVARIGALRLLIAGAAAAVVRWSVMAFDPPLAVLLPLQVLHGLTYGAAHLGAIHFIGRAVPESAAGTAQALYATVAAGIAMGGATLLTGWLYRAHGSGAYFAMAGLALVGLAAALAVQRAWSGGELWCEQGAGSRAIPTAPVSVG